MHNYELLISVTEYVIYSAGALQWGLYHAC